MGFLRDVLGTVQNVFREAIPIASAIAPQLPPQYGAPLQQGLAAYASYRGGMAGSVSSQNATIPMQFFSPPQQVIQGDPGPCGQAMRRPRSVRRQTYRRRRYY